jgi:hypothetical protein
VAQSSSRRRRWFIILRAITNQLLSTVASVLRRTVHFVCFAFLGKRVVLFFCFFCFFF